MSYDGGKIALLRAKKGWSMAELARRAGIRGPSLWALEHQVTKEPKATTLIRIANALGVNLREITRPAKKGEAADLAGELIGVFEQLDGANKQVLLAAARAMRENQK